MLSAKQPFGPPIAIMWYKLYTARSVTQVTGMAGEGNGSWCFWSPTWSYWVAIKYGTYVLQVKQFMCCFISIENIYGVNAEAITLLNFCNRFWCCFWGSPNRSALYSSLIWTWMRNTMICFLVCVYGLLVSGWRNNCIYAVAYWCWVKFDFISWCLYSYCRYWRVWNPVQKRPGDHT